MLDISDILKELNFVEKDGKINHYTLKYAHKQKASNFAIALPSNQNTHILREFCNSLSKKANFSCQAFDPTGTSEDTYECLPLSSVMDIWNDIESLINASAGLRESPNRKQLSSTNFTLCHLKYKNENFWIGTKQQKAESVFKGRHPFLATEDELVLIKPDEVLSLSLNVDFIVCPDLDSPHIYIFNKNNFVSIFNYFEMLKEHIRTRVHIVSEWTFIDNPLYIQEKIDTAYVFKGIAKIIDDSEYLKQIKRTRPQTLKKRLIEKCANSFSEEDFDGYKIKCTQSNLEKIIKMISKGFKYNFFADKAEA